jgi:NADPH-dependent curcumin reductase CurA
MLLRAVTCTLGANKALLDRPARADGGLPRARLYMSRAAEAIDALAGWVQAGKIKNKVDVRHGLENAPATVRRLFEGCNEGKQLPRVAE